MKKMIVGMFAIAGMLAAFAFRGDVPKNNNREVTYWFPTDANGQVTDFEISTSETMQPCSGGVEEFCALGYSEDSPYITVSGNTVTLNDSDPLQHGLPAKRDQ